MDSKQYFFRDLNSIKPASGRTYISASRIIVTARTFFLPLTHQEGISHDEMQRGRLLVARSVRSKRNGILSNAQGILQLNEQAQIPGTQAARCFDPAMYVPALSLQFKCIYECFEQVSLERKISLSIIYVYIDQSLSVWQVENRTSYKNRTNKPARKSDAYRKRNTVDNANVLDGIPPT